MRVHPRFYLVEKARNELYEKLNDIWQRDKLTSLEVVHILAQMTASQTRYPLREERHPDDPDKRADEA